MLIKSARKIFSFSLNFFIFFLFSYTSLKAGHFEKIFNIQDQKKIKDLSFELEISDLKKNLESKFPLKKLDKFKIKIFWLNDGSFNISFNSFPKGNKALEKRLKLQVLQILKILFPSDKLKELKKRYQIRKKNKKIIATNINLNRRKVIVDLNNNELISKIESFFPLNKIIEKYEYKKIGSKFFIVSGLEQDSAYKGNYSKKTNYTYKNINNNNLPIKIEIIDQIKTVGNKSVKDTNIKIFKRFYLFNNYQINKGNAKAHFDNIKRKKNE